MIERRHCEHESRHVVAVWAVGDGLRIDRVAVDIHAPQEGLMSSRRVRGTLGISDLIVSLCGWIGDPDLPEAAVWPEPYPPRLDAPDSVGVITQRLALSEEQYRGACRIAEELCETPEFKEAVDLVARALCIAPSLDFEALEALRQVTAFGDPEEVAA